MKRVLFLIMIMTCVTLTIRAQSSGIDYPKAEVFIGYSQNRIKVQSVGASNVPRIERIGFNGFDAQVTYNINHVFGVAADLSGHYHNEITTALGTQQEIKSNFYNFLIGPVIKLRNKSRVEPFAHGLFGAARSSLSGLGNATDSRTGFAMAFGGGLDVGVAKHLAIRAIQADYNPAFFGGHRLDNIRLSFGVIIK